QPVRAPLVPKAAPATSAPSPRPIEKPTERSSRPAAVSVSPIVEQALPLSLPGETAVPAPSPALSPDDKAAAFAELRQRAMACVKCPHLASSRKSVVFGVGSINAQLMFVGEAPGADEDDQGEPFVGKAGQLLTKIVETMGLTRDS